MPAITGRILLVTTLQKKPRLFVALLVQIMEQRRRRGLPRQLASQLIDPPEEWLQVGLGIRRRDRLHLLLQVQKRLQYLSLRLAHPLTHSSVAKLYQGQIG